MKATHCSRRAANNFSTFIAKDRKNFFHKLDGRNLNAIRKFAQDVHELSTSFLNNSLAPL
jgi:hypothetical protein